MKPLLNLSKTEKQYWPILTNAQTTNWSEVEIMMASQMCRDLGTVAELASADYCDELLPEICRRIYQGSKLLKLDRHPAGNSAQHRIVQAIFAGV